MNRSGQAVVYLVRRYGVTDLANLLVIADDMDLPLGTLRMRSAGSDAGHNGIRSIIDALGTQAFPRLRLGVGRPTVGQDPVQYVLGRFRRDERPAVAQAVAVASDAIECWLESGLEEAMNRFNRALSPEVDPS
jgi:PTH1 family peptidyl-tRNA hydrolase